MSKIPPPKWGIHKSQEGVPCQEKTEWPQGIMVVVVVVVVVEFIVSK